MKYCLILLIILLPFGLRAGSIKPGDNLQAALKKIATPYYFDAPPFTAWSEGKEMLLIAEKPDPNDCDYVFLALKDTTLIGVFFTQEPHAFLFDKEGTSIVTDSSDFFYLPLWTVKHHTKITASDTTILSVMNELYEKMLQADESEVDPVLVQRYERFQSDTTLANRHIALLFDSYQTLISATAAQGARAPAEICIPLMETLARECESLYKHIPVVVYLYWGEALESAGLTDKARQHFKTSLDHYPNSVPLQVKNYHLEQDPVKREEQLKRLKKEHRRHWMVKDL